MKTSDNDINFGMDEGGSPEDIIDDINRASMELRKSAQAK